MNRLNENATTIANYIIATGATRRQAAEHFNCGHSTIGFKLKSLKTTNPELYAQVEEIAKTNKSLKPATRTESPVEITTQPETNIFAAGIRSSKNCHPVLCIDTGEIYASGADAAEAIGVTQGSLSQNVVGITKTVRGLHFCKVSDMSNNINAISATIKSANAEIEAAKAEANAKVAAAEEEKERYAALVAPLEEIKATKAEIEAHHGKIKELKDALEAEYQALDAAEVKLLDLYAKL